MAEVFEGLFITIGAKTIEFQKGLKGANQALTALRKDIVNLNRELKFNPQSLDTLEKKAANFRQQIEINSDKINTYKTQLAKLGDADIGTKEWLRLTQNLQAAENAGKTLARSLEATERQIKAVGDPGSIYNLDKAIQAAAQDVAILDGKLHLDPKNTRLVSEQMAALAKVSDLSAQKVERLRQEQAALGKDAIGTQAWRDYEQAIVDTQLQAAQLSESIKNFSTVTGDVGASAGRLREAFAGAFDAVKEIATSTGATLAAVLGTSLGKGFGRLAAIDMAEAKMRGLGFTAREVAGIMDTASNSVLGTSFSLDEAATAASQSLTAGIQPGKELNRVLNAMVATASATGAPLSDISRIFTQISATGKAYTSELNELSNRGLPIFKGLQETLGVTREELNKLAKTGKISFEDILAAAEKTTGSVAAEVGGTLVASVRNFNASLARSGANLQKSVFPKLAPLVQTLTAAMKPLEERAKNIGVAIGNMVNPAIDRFASFIERTVAGTNGLTKRLINMRKTILPLAASFSALAVGGLGSVASSIPGVSSLLGPLTRGLTALGTPLGVAAAGFAGLVASNPALRSALKDTADSLRPMMDEVNKLAASLGEAVSSILPSIAQALTGLIPVIGQLVKGLTPLIQFIGEMVQGFADLPGPIQVATLSVAGFLTIRKSLSAGVGSLVASLADLGSKFRLTGTQINAAGGSFTGFTGKAKVAGLGLKNGLGAAAAGVMGLFGGPWGLALAGAAAGVGALATTFGKTAQSAEIYKKSVLEAAEATGTGSKQTTKALMDLSRSGEEWSDQTSRWALGAKNAQEGFKIIGVSVQGLIQDMQKGGSALDMQRYKVDQIVEAYNKSGKAGEEMALSLGYNKEQIDQMNRGTWIELQRSLERVREGFHDATEAEGEHSKALQDLEAKYDKFNDALKKRDDLQSTVNERTRAAKYLTDELTGGIVDQEVAIQKQGESQRNLKQVFDESAAAVGGMAQNLWDAKKNTLAVTDEGKRLLDQLVQNRDATLESTSAIFDSTLKQHGFGEASKAATAEIEKNRAEVIKFATDIGLTSEQAETLTNRLYGIPGRTAFEVTDDSSIPLQAMHLQGLIEKIDEVPDKTFRISENSSEALKQMLQQLNYNIDEIHDGVITVKAPEAKPTEEQIRKVQKASDELPKDKNIEVSSNADAVKQDLNNLNNFALQPKYLDIIERRSGSTQSPGRAFGGFSAPLSFPFPQLPTTFAAGRSTVLNVNVNARGLGARDIADSVARDVERIIVKRVLT